jgi:uroporphyrin-III C-methyltransferase
MSVGTVFLVGAGPGDPELLTLKAARIIATADVVVYDRLVPPEVIDLIPEGAARIFVGKEAGNHTLPQPEINEMLVRLGRSGRNVVRLKGGDPFVFGRGCEEAGALECAGIPYKIVPGITAAQGCAAAARVPLTHRGLASGLRYVTGHCKSNEPLDLDWASLADPDTTLVVYMGLANAEEITARLIENGLPGSTPVIAISQGTTPRERRLRTNLADMPRAVGEARLATPVLFIIGRVAALAVGSDLNADETTSEAAAVA